MGAGLACRVAEPAHGYAAPYGCLAAVAPHRPYVVVVGAVVSNTVVIEGVSSCTNCCYVAVDLIIRQRKGSVFNRGVQHKTVCVVIIGVGKVFNPVVV